MGFVQCHSDHTCFIRCQTQGQCIIILVYVDDIIITGDNTSGIVQVKCGLRRSFDVKNLGHLRYFLGIEVARSGKAYLYLNGSIHLTFFRIQVCLGVDLPLHLWSQILGYQQNHGELLPNPFIYQRLVGASFIWRTQGQISRLLLALWANLCTHDLSFRCCVSHSPVP